MKQGRRWSCAVKHSLWERQRKKRESEIGYEMEQRRILLSDARCSSLETGSAVRKRTDQAIGVGSCAERRRTRTRANGFTERAGSLDGCICRARTDTSVGRADSQALEVKYASSVKIWLLSGILQVVSRVSHAYRFSNMMLIWCFDIRMAPMEFDCCHSTIPDTP